MNFKMHLVAIGLAAGTVGFFYFLWIFGRGLVMI